MSPRPRRIARWGLTAAASAFVCGTAAAQATLCPVVVRDSGRVWTPPLDRVVTLQDSGASVRTALDLLAARAGVRLSYSSDALPLDREACVLRGPRTLGAALSEVLHGVSVTPVSSGGAQVVLTPTRIGFLNVAPRTATLDRVVVTGSAAGAAQRGLPYALDVMQGRDLRGGATPTLAQALNGSIPGLWIWSDAPTTLLSRFGSLRGASSFGVSAPKVFVDGIEIANPLLLSRISADAIDRIEVIRGPQGAALYGADAISGVVNIQLRHDGATDGSRDASVRSSAGAAQSDYAAAGAFTQEHSLSLRAGSAANSASAVVGFNSTGAIVPGGGTAQLNVDATARHVAARTIYSGTARLWHAKSDAPLNPVLQSIGGNIAGAEAALRQNDQSVTQYTLGGTITNAPDAAWTQTITAGIDGYRLSGLSVDILPIPSALDVALRGTQGGSDKASVRASSVVRFGSVGATSGTLTLAGDASLLRDATTGVAPSALTRPFSGAPRPSTIVASPRWLTTTGVGAQGTISFRETIYLTAGVRGEHNDGFSDASRFALLPSVGASVVRQFGDMTWKTRVAYGAGLRPARTPMRETGWRGYGIGDISSNLQPERQIGVEAGMDLFWKRNFSLQVTRFDQRASSLIQQVMTYTGTGRGDDSVGGRNYSLPPSYGYALVSLGAITNRGWEFAMRQSLGAVAVAASLSLVSSRVDQVAPGYIGDLREGDRMLAVPGRTAGATVTWTPLRWQLQLGASHVDDWINYDRLGLATTYLNGGAPARELYGSTLRSYWTQYDGVTRLRLSVAHDLTRTLSVRFIGDNLLDRQRGEPDNVTIVPGRTLSFGVGARF
jgi:iron complex outermembrane recepter protein